MFWKMMSLLLSLCAALAIAVVVNKAMAPLTEVANVLGGAL